LFVWIVERQILRYGEDGNGLTIYRQYPSFVPQDEVSTIVSWERLIETGGTKRRRNGEIRVGSQARELLELFSIDVSERNAVVLHALGSHAYARCDA